MNTKQSTVRKFSASELNDKMTNINNSVRFIFRLISKFKFTEFICRIHGNIFLISLIPSR